MERLKISLPDGLRALIEAASTKVGHSLAEEIRQRLERSYAEGPTDAKTQTLMNAVAMMARMIEETNGESWHKSATAHATFAKMISLWLDANLPTRPMGTRLAAAGRATRGERNPPTTGISELKKMGPEQLFHIFTMMERNRAQMIEFHRHMARTKKEDSNE